MDLQSLIHTHNGHLISPRNLSSNHGRERGDGKTLAHQEQQWGMGVVRKKEGRSQLYPLTHNLSNTQTRTGISCLCYLEILVRERTKCPQRLFLQWLEQEDFRTTNFSDGLEFLGRALLTPGAPPHWKFQLGPTKILVNYGQPTEDSCLEK